MDEKLIVIKTIEDFKKLYAYLADKDYVAFDTETTGLDKSSEIIGFSICSEIDLAYYVVLSYWDPTQKKIIYLETLDMAKDFLEWLKCKQLIMHNAVFDCMIVENYFKVSLIQSLFHDTMISGHLLDENRSNGLKERGVELYGEDVRKEQLEMKESVHKNGGMLTKQNYELYKADADLIAFYGAKDALLTLKLFYEDVEQLFKQKLDKFFYEDESMPLLKGPTYQLNTTGLRVDAEALSKLKGSLEAECMELKAYIHSEIQKHVKDKYPGTGKTNHFNIGSSKQLAWLLYFKLDNDFHTLTKGGRELCKSLEVKIPYSLAAKREFIRLLTDNKGRVYESAKFNPKTKKMGRPKKIGDPWNYIACGKESLGKLSKRYKWVAKLLEYAKALKLLNTYVIGIQDRMKYNVINPSFLQHGPVTGRYSSKNPNFQNLPKNDKRVKACIVARPGKVFVGADWEQLEPRIFASISKDETLLACFKKGEDFYSVVGAPVFNKEGYSMYKHEENSFAKKFSDLRDQAKVIALAKPYGRTNSYMASQLGITIEEAASIGDKYFEAYPKVELMMLESHEEAKTHGVVYSMFGRPRRIPEALQLKKIYGNTPHHELPYTARTLLNQAMNFKAQGSAASIMNRSMIAYYNRKIPNTAIVLTIHDEMVIECDEKDADLVSKHVKDCMENTVQLQGVALKTEPKVGKTLADLK